jgi:hypothetical protein
LSIDATSIINGMSRENPADDRFWCIEYIWSAYEVTGEEIRLDHTLVSMIPTIQRLPAIGSTEATYNTGATLFINQSKRPMVPVTFVVLLKKENQGDGIVLEVNYEFIISALTFSGLNKMRELFTRAEIM